jgi:phosphate transport system substrate-binding protein
VPSVSQGGKCYLGEITNWDDAELNNTNPGADLPNHPIIVAFCPDGSGTTYVWTDYLSKVGKAWNNDVGFGTSVMWPVGVGAQGNGGVAAIVQQTPSNVPSNNAKR